jgi:hypothetical protein
VAGGASELAAQTAAVQRFGPVGELVAAEQRRQVPAPAAVAGQVVATAWLLGAIAAVAVGVSGLIAEVVRLVAGIPVLVDVAAGQGLAAVDCTRWLAADPTAATCRDAALSDWAAEVVGYRVALGLLGVIALLAYPAMRRIRFGRVDMSGHGGLGRLPAVVSDSIAFTGFALAAGGTLILGVNAVVTASGHGSGQWFNATPVALGVAAVFGWRLLRDRLSPGPAPACHRPDGFESHRRFGAGRWGLMESPRH